MPTDDDAAALRAEVAQLREALVSRGLIGQAVGVVMALRHCSPVDAFALLKTRSQHDNVKLRVVAARVVALASSDSSLERCLRELAGIDEPVAALSPGSRGRSWRPARHHTRQHTRQTSDPLRTLELVPSSTAPAPRTRPAAVPASADG